VVGEKYCLSVEEMGKKLGIGRPKAYELSRMKGFPAVTIGRRTLIPIKALEEWLKQQAGGDRDGQAIERS